jgi:hypothetical protein
MVEIAAARHTDSREVGRQLGQCLAGAAPKAVWALAFCGGKHDPAAFLDGLRETLGTVPVVGGSAPGVIVPPLISYAGFEAAVALFGEEDPGGPILVDHGLAEGERETGRRLAAKLEAEGRGDQPVLLLYDSIACRTPLRLHPASPLVQGLRDVLDRPGAPAPIIGSGLITDLNLGDSWVFDGSGVAKHCAVAVPLGEGFEVVTEVMHGCRPASSFMTITRIEGAEVFELDGRPAYEVIIEWLGGEAALPGLSLSLTLGAKHGDPFAPFDENAYVNRLILGADRARGSITIFEPDFAAGEQVQVMSRDNQLMLDSVRRGGAAAARRIAEGESPALCLYVNCAGRASVRSGAEREESGLLCEILPKGLPLFGFYSGVEVAPMAEGPSMPLDWTGVLAVVRRRSR